MEENQTPKQDSAEQPQRPFRGLYRHVKVSVKTLDRIIIGGIAATVLLVLFAYYVVIPLLILGLFLGFRYRFSGPDLERDDLNGMMGTVADTAADLGRQVMDELKHDWHSDETKRDDGPRE